MKFKFQKQEFDILCGINQDLLAVFAKMTGKFADIATQHGYIRNPDASITDVYDDLHAFARTMDDETIIRVNDVILISHNEMHRIVLEGFSTGESSFGWIMANPMPSDTSDSIHNVASDAIKDYIGRSGAAVIETLQETINGYVLFLQTCGLVHSMYRDIRRQETNRAMERIIAQLSDSPELANMASSLNEFDKSLAELNKSMKEKVEKPTTTH